MKGDNVALLWQNWQADGCQPADTTLLWHNASLLQGNVRAQINVVELRYVPLIERKAKQAQWVKIRNTAYSQWEGREKLFEREREVDPDIYLWDSCVAACEHQKFANTRHQE